MGGASEAQRGFVLIALITAALILLLAIDANASPRRLIFATGVTIDPPPSSTASLAGRSLAFSGRVAAKGLSCRRARRVSLHIVSASGDAIVGTARTTKKGRWTIAAIAPGGSFSGYVQIAKKKTKRVICKHATSAPVAFINRAVLPKTILPAPVADTTGPVISIVSPQDPITGPTPTFAFAATDAAPFFAACSIDGTPRSCESAVPFEEGPLANGSHTFRVEATDAFGNLSATERSFEVDAQGPTVVITAPAEASTVPSNFSLIFTASDPAEPVQAQCALDGSPFSCSSPQPFESVGSGPHTITVVAVDAFGNASAPAIVNFTVS